MNKQFKELDWVEFDFVNQYNDFSGSTYEICFTDDIYRIWSIWYHVDIDDPGSAEIIECYRIDGGSADLPETLEMLESQRIDVLYSINWNREQDYIASCI